MQHNSIEIDAILGMDYMRAVGVMLRPMRTGDRAWLLSLHDPSPHQLGERPRH